MKYTYMSGRFVYQGYCLMIGALLLGFTQKMYGYQALDVSDPVFFAGDHLVYAGRTILLGPKAFFVDGQLTAEEASKQPFVYRSVNEAAKHLTDGTEDSPMVLYLAPWVYWIDDPDYPEVRVARPGSSPYGLEIKCEWLRFQGLTKDPGKVVLACNRGQTLGSRGNFTMFRFSGQGTSSENLTFGNYCNVDLDFPLKPELSRSKRASAIVQAQLIHCDGDKIVARNTRFISRLNLCPFVGGKRVLFDRCHFESTDDALCGTGVYLHCTLDFYSSKPFYNTSGTGAVFLDCDIRCLTRGDQYFTKAAGQVVLVDTRLTAQEGTYVGWRDRPPFETRNYQYGATLNGKSLTVGARDLASTVDMSGKLLLDAYRFEYGGKVVYNTYNLLSGSDDWDPTGLRETVLSAEKEFGRKLTCLPVQLRVPPIRKSLETGKDSVLLTAIVNRFGNVISTGKKNCWKVEKGQESLVLLKPNGEGSACLVVPTNVLDETVPVRIIASTASGLEGAAVLTVAPPKLDAPKFLKGPKITLTREGKLRVDYQLDMRFKDQSLVTWYRCRDNRDNRENHDNRDNRGKDPMEVAVSRLDEPMLDYPLSPGDIGYFLKVSVQPKHLRCDAGPEVVYMMKKPISVKDVKADSKVLQTDFRNVSVKNQRQVIPGFWTFAPLQSADPSNGGQTDFSRDAWYFGPGEDGSADRIGLLQGRNASMSYTPVGNSFGDMKLSMTLAPFKTAGQGFSVAHLYMDVLIKLDAATMSGYGLRFIRTTKYGNAVDGILVRYDRGKVTEISRPVTTSCFRTPCRISLEVTGNRLKVQASTSAVFMQDPAQSEVLPEVNLETEIEPNTFGGFGIQYTGGSSTMICEMNVNWL
jgi:hypothetical protein